MRLPNQPTPSPPYLLLNTITNAARVISTDTPNAASTQISNVGLVQKPRSGPAARSTVFPPSSIFANASMFTSRRAWIGPSPRLTAVGVSASNGG